MRAIQRRKATSPTSLVLCAASGVAGIAGVALMAGMPACADALHLDPPGADGGTSHDAGGDAGLACRSNQDCAYPKPTCDTVLNACVECVSSEDCSTKPGTACSKGTCQCPNPSAPAMPLTWCAGESPSCVDTQTSPANCGVCGHTCFGSCAAGKCADKWEPIPTAGAPDPRSHHVGVWTGSQMFVWGGKSGGTLLDTGGLYDPAKHTWTTADVVGAPSPRQDATAVWDDVDKVVIVWGGVGPGGVLLATGGRYSPSKNTWAATNVGTAPPARANHSAVWVNPLAGFGAAAGMIVWGGTLKGGRTNDGAVYDPALDKWTAMDVTGAPSPRAFHTAVWDSTANRMIVFGGLGTSVPPPPPPMDVAESDAFAYDPAMNGTGTTWTTLPAGGAPGKRYQHTAAFDPVTMMTFVWGGYDLTTYLQDGAKLSVSGAAWTALGSPSPEARVGHSAVVVAAAGKSQMIVFGGDQGGSSYLGSAWSLDTSTGNTWTLLPTALSPRTHHTGVANGSTMLVWGGDTASGPTNTGAVWDASP